MRRIAGWRRRCFVSRIPALTQAPGSTVPESPFNLLAFCGQKDFPEQVASWRSLRRWVGRPRRTVLVSDGSLGEREIGLLRKLEPRLEVVSLEEFGGERVTGPMRRYAAAIPMGRKLWVMRSMDSLAPCLYSDSDILYFRPAAEMAEASWWAGGSPSYLQDPYPSLDLRLLRGESENTQPVNAGFLAIRGPLDWTVPMDRFGKLDGDPVFFTEQTLTHLAVRASGGVPLDPERYVLRIEDQWWARDAFSGPAVAMRHYVSHIRYKMWMKVPILS